MASRSTGLALLALLLAVAAVPSGGGRSGRIQAGAGHGYVSVLPCMQAGDRCLALRCSRSSAGKRDARNARAHPTCTHNFAGTARHGGSGRGLS
eukprot:scaffold73856_cov21-Tisochrysis_lutea.AAC.9